MFMDPLLFMEQVSTMIPGGETIIIPVPGHGDSTVVIIPGMDGALVSDMVLAGLIPVLVIIGVAGVADGGDLLSITLPIGDMVAVSIRMVSTETMCPSIGTLIL